MRMLNGFLLAATLALASGCARNSGIYTTYEERYRLFFLSDQASPTALAINAATGQPDDPTATARTFSQMASLNLGFEELCNEGFQLSRVEAVSDGDGATQFTFRRKINEWYVPTTGPMEMLGIFALVGEEGSTAPPTYYIFDPLKGGFLIHFMTPEGDTQIPARWDGEKVVWRDGDNEHSITLAPDGRSVLHRTTTLNLQSEITADTTVEAIRVIAKR